MPRNQNGVPMTDKKKPTVTLVNSRYQPTKAEMEEPLEFPEGTTPEDVAKVITRDVNIRWTDRPE